MKLIEVLKNLLFPKICLGCGKWGEYLCSDCLNFIKVCDTRICPVCQKPSFAGLTHFSCQRSWSLDGLTSIFVYKGIIKRAITKLKYNFVTDLKEIILDLFLSFCGEDKALTKFISQENVFLVPVPLFWQRQNWRGFNQSELLGEIMAKKLGIGFLPKLLLRSKNTSPQARLEKKKREENVLGTFKFNSKLNINFISLRVVLFDDVWTTGATIRECTKVLKRKGIREVWGLTLAR